MIGLRGFGLLNSLKNGRKFFIFAKKWNIVLLFFSRKLTEERKALLIRWMNSVRLACKLPLAQNPLSENLISSQQCRT